MIRASHAVVAATLLGCPGSSSDREPPPSPPPRDQRVGAPEVASAGDAPSFGLYVLALSWAPSFCCTHADKEECAGLADAFAGTHLTLHGLWPNFTDAEATRDVTYPQFCGAYKHCKRAHDRSCEPDPSTLPDAMKTLGPGYVGDHDFLAAHEWPKHGSCSGLDPAAYFRAALAAMTALPGDGTPDVLRTAIGSDLALADLERAFGVPKESVLLSCDARCGLSQVSFCLAHDARGLPTTPIACPSNTTSAQYDNGCVTRGCARVAIPAVGSCDASHPKPKQQPSAGGRCSHPGQGPACTGNAECMAAGFSRCARSGCCTSQPK